MVKRDIAVVFAADLDVEKVSHVSLVLSLPATEKCGAESLVCGIGGFAAV